MLLLLLFLFVSFFCFQCAFHFIIISFVAPHLVVLLLLLLKIVCLLFEVPSKCCECDGVVILYLTFQNNKIIKILFDFQCYNAKRLLICICFFFLSSYSFVLFCKDKKTQKPFSQLFCWIQKKKNIESLNWFFYASFIIFCDCRRARFVCCICNSFFSPLNIDFRF